MTIRALLVCFRWTMRTLHGCKGLVNLPCFGPLAWLVVADGILLDSRCLIMLSGLNYRCRVGHPFSLVNGGACGFLYASGRALLFALERASER
jgi:hypothetical protein